MFIKKNKYSEIIDVKDSILITIVKDYIIYLIFDSYYYSKGYFSKFLQLFILYLYTNIIFHDFDIHS